MVAETSEQKRQYLYVGMVFNINIEQSPVERAGGIPLLFWTAPLVAATYNVGRLAPNKGMTMTQAEFVLGRRVPSDWRHVEQYPYAAVQLETAPVAERTLDLPNYRPFYDQRREGACVGFSTSWMMSILNRRRYCASWLWREAKTIDEWADTTPEDNNGTSIRAALDVLRTVGHVRQWAARCLPPSLAEGVIENRWATTVDQIRTCIASGTPVTIGVNWYANFDRPVREGLHWWVGKGDLGYLRGGHAICLYCTSDHLEAVGFVNSWGSRYPLALMPYQVLERLLEEEGEATMVTNRTG